MPRSRWQLRSLAVVVIAAPALGALLAVSAFDAQLGPSLQIAGACYELIGIATVIWGIVEIRRRFTDRPSIVEDLKQSLKRVLDKLRGKQQSTTVVGQAVEASWAVGTASVKTTDEWDQHTVEQRVDHLRQRLDSQTKSLRDDLTSKGKELQQSNRRRGANTRSARR